MTGGKIGYQHSSGDGRPGNILAEAGAQDLREYGMIPEFVGRFPVITYVDPLDCDALTRILTEPVGSLVSQYTELMRQDGIEQVITDEVIRYVAEQAAALGTGARGLRNIMEKIMRDAMFDAPLLSAKGKASKLTIGMDKISGSWRLDYKKTA